MTQHGEDRDRFSDEELAFLRHVEFGELPERVRPEQRVEFTEADDRRTVPEPQRGVPQYWVPQG